MKNNQYDVIIVGAGMVGATLACALGQSKLRIAILEPSLPAMEWPSDSVDLRVSAVSCASQRIFKSLGAWDSIARLGISPFHEMRVWDSSGGGSIHFDSAELGVSEMGHIVENRVIRRALLEQVATCDNIKLLCPAALDSVDVQCDAVTVMLEEGQELQASLLVGADGGRSKVRDSTQIVLRGWDYEQRGVVTTVSTALPHQNTAWQRFYSDGPLAFLPLANGQSSIVWSTSIQKAEMLLAMDNTLFCEELAMAFEHKLGAISDAGQRAAFPLKLQHATTYTKPRIALVGDAAHMIHPLAGQGANLGFLDAAALAQTLLTACEANKDVGSIKTLRRYERWRKGENLIMMSAMDGFKRVFGIQAPLMGKARHLGLNVTDHFTPLKHIFMRHAMGISGDLPKIAQGFY